MKPKPPKAKAKKLAAKPKPKAKPIPITTGNVEDEIDWVAVNMFLDPANVQQEWADSLESYKFMAWHWNKVMREIAKRVSSYEEYVEFAKAVLKAMEPILRRLVLWETSAGHARHRLNYFEQALKLENPDFFKRVDRLERERRGARDGPRTRKKYTLNDNFDLIGQLHREYKRILAIPSNQPWTLQQIYPLMRIKIPRSNPTKYYEKSTVEVYMRKFRIADQVKQAK